MFVVWKDMDRTSACIAKTECMIIAHVTFIIGCSCDIHYWLAHIHVDNNKRYTLSTVVHIHTVREGWIVLLYSKRPVSINSLHTLCSDNFYTVTKLWATYAIVHSQIELERKYRMPSGIRFEFDPILFKGRIKMISENWINLMVHSEKLIYSFKYVERTV